MDRAITGDVVPCPNCERATGVPVPAQSAVVDDAAEADGSSTTKCPSCDRRFEVYYRLESRG